MISSNFQLASKRNIFPSYFQRSVLNENGIRSKPVWSVEETGLQNELKIIQSQWKIILDEALSVLDSKSGGFTKYFEEINEGKWFYEPAMFGLQLEAVTKVIIEKSRGRRFLWNRN